MFYPLVLITFLFTVPTPTLASPPLYGEEGLACLGNLDPAAAQKILSTVYEIPIQGEGWVNQNEKLLTSTLIKARNANQFETVVAGLIEDTIHQRWRISVKQGDALVANLELNTRPREIHFKERDEKFYLSVTEPNGKLSEFWVNSEEDHQFQGFHRIDLNKILARKFYKIDVVQVKHTAFLENSRGNIFANRYAKKMTFYRSGQKGPIARLDTIDPETVHAIDANNHSILVADKTKILIWNKPDASGDLDLKSNQASHQVQLLHPDDSYDQFQEIFLTQNNDLITRSKSGLFNAVHLNETGESPVQGLETLRSLAKDNQLYFNYGRSLLTFFNPVTGELTVAEIDGGVAKIHSRLTEFKNCTLSVEPSQFGKPKHLAVTFSYPNGHISRTFLSGLFPEVKGI